MKKTLLITIVTLGTFCAFGQAVELGELPFNALIETNAPSRAETTNIVEAAIGEITAETLGALVAETDTLATVTGRGGTTASAVTIGSRGAGAVGLSSFAQGFNTTPSGGYSHAEGYQTTASGDFSHAEGSGTTASWYFSHAEGVGTTASGYASHASGFNSVASNITSFAWQGTDGGFAEPEYGSHGNGTFNINPVGGLAGLWIGETTLGALLDDKADAADVAVAVAHAQSAHGLTDNGGFAGGDRAIAADGGAVGYLASATTGGAVGAGASATTGGAVGDLAYADNGGFAGGAGAYATDGGAVGDGAYATDGGAVGHFASTTTGGAVGYEAYATDGGAVGAYASALSGGGAVGYEAMTSSGFAGGYRAMAALDNTGYGTPIDAIQLGTGWNPDANTLQIYGYKLMNADGSIPAERMATTLSGYATTGAVAAVQAEVGAGTNWLTRTGLSGTVAFANDGGRPQAWSGSGNLIVAEISGLASPSQVYWTLQGFDSVTLPAGIYAVGGGTWQAGMVNHFTLWQVGDTTMITFLTATEIE